MKNALTTYALQVHLQVDRREVLDECLTELREMPRLQVLSITVGSFILDERQMAVLGAMPLADLRLLSQVLLSLLSPTPSHSLLPVSCFCVSCPDRLCGLISIT
jgi:hypothetical protein